VTPLLLVVEVVEIFLSAPGESPKHLHFAVAGAQRLEEVDAQPTNAVMKVPRIAGIRETPWLE